MVDQKNNKDNEINLEEYKAWRKEKSRKAINWIRDYVPEGKVICKDWYSRSGTLKHRIRFIIISNGSINDRRVKSVDYKILSETNYKYDGSILEELNHHNPSDIYSVHKSHLKDQLSLMKESVSVRWSVEI